MPDDETPVPVLSQCVAVQTRWRPRPVIDICTRDVHEDPMHFDEFHEWIWVDRAPRIPRRPRR